jgi:outer membrane protein insertion porin family/translocation and assembly module TamA
VLLHPARGRALAVLALAVSSLACTTIPKGRASVDAVGFDGVNEVNDSDIEDKIATAATPKFLGLFRGVMYDYEIYDPYVLAQDLERIERYYRTQGYYEAHARVARAEYVAANHVRVTIDVDEGVPVLVGAIYVAGAEGLPADVRRDMARGLGASGLIVGNRFEEAQFTAASSQLQHALERNAYAYAKVERHAEVDLPTHTVRVVFTVIPDRPATLGKVTIVGLGSLPETPVRRALHLGEGKPYSSDDLDAAQQAALDLGVFSSVAVTPQKSDPPPPDRVVPVTVTVSPLPLRTLQVGGGIELDSIKTDIHGRIEWTDQNFLGGLRKFDVDFRPGVVLYPTRLPSMTPPQRFLPEEWTRIEVRQPGVFEPRTGGYLRGAFNIYPLLLTPEVDEAAPVVGYIESRGTVGFDRSIWKFYGNLSYNLQNNIPFPYIPSRPIDPDLQAVLVSYLDLLTTLDFRDDKVRPHKGVLIGNETQFAGLGGDAVDFRVQPQVRVFFPVRRSTLAFRATTGLLFPLNYGTIDAHAPPGEVPPGVDRSAWIHDEQLIFLRGFFSGGPSSNRGYPVFGVGPHGPVPFLTPALAVQQLQNECVIGSITYNAARCALPLGGQTLWEFSTEFRLPITEAFTQATFCDTSDVERAPVTYAFAPHDLHLSCGFGLRYNTPAGPIRLDIAYRIPGFNPVPGDIDYPGDVFGIPIGLAFGIGEAF